MADRADDIVGHALAGAADREGIGDRLALEAGRHPAVPDGGEEIQIGGIMHLSRRFQPMRLGRHDIGKTRLLHRRQDPFGAERRLEGRHKLTVVQLGLGIAQLVVFGIDDAHFRSCPCIRQCRDLHGSAPDKKAASTLLIVQDE